MPEEKRPYSVSITYESGETLWIKLWTKEQVADCVAGATATKSGFYGFTDPGDDYPSVSFRREGIIFVQVFKNTPAEDADTLDEMKGKNQ